MVGPNLKEAITIKAGLKISGNPDPRIVVTANEPFDTPCIVIVRRAQRQLLDPNPPAFSFRELRLPTG